jgi:hypothetical protein
MDRLLRAVAWRRIEATGFRTGRINSNCAPTVAVDRAE